MRVFAYLKDHFQIPPPKGSLTAHLLSTFPLPAYWLYALMLLGVKIPSTKASAVLLYMGRAGFPARFPKNCIDNLVLFLSQHSEDSVSTSADATEDILSHWISVSPLFAVRLGQCSLAMGRYEFFNKISSILIDQLPELDVSGQQACAGLSIEAALKISRIPRLTGGSDHGEKRVNHQYIPTRWLMVGGPTLLPVLVQLLSSLDEGFQAQVSEAVSSAQSTLERISDFLPEVYLQKIQKDLMWLKAYDRSIRLRSLASPVLDHQSIPANPAL